MEILGDTGETKMSCKGTDKSKNDMLWENYERAASGSREIVTNCGFKREDGKIWMYEVNKAGLSNYYDKRLVLDCMRKTSPLF